MSELLFLDQFASPFNFVAFEGVTFKSVIIMPSETDVAPGAMFVLQFWKAFFYENRNF